MKTNGCHHEHLATSCAGSIAQPVMRDRARREDTTFLRPPFYMVRFVDLRFNCSQREKMCQIWHHIPQWAPHCKGSVLFPRELTDMICFSTRRHLPAKDFNTAQTNVTQIDLKKTVPQVKWQDLKVYDVAASGRRAESSLNRAESSL